MNDGYYWEDDYDNPDIGDGYQVLYGPNNFECVITEPEDRNFGRDLSKLVVELNRLYDENQKLKSNMNNKEAK